MAIKNRRGNYVNFDESKMVPGELAVVVSGDPNTITGKAIYVCFALNDVQRFITDVEVAAAIERAIEQSEEFQEVVQTTVTETLEDHPEWTTTVQDGAVTPEKLSTTFVTGLTESASGDDTDLLTIGYRGTSTLRKFSLANLAAYIRDKLTSLTFSALNTSNKTLPGAINELNTKTLTTSATCQQIASGTVVTNSVLKKSGVVFLTYSVTGVTTAGMQGTICTLPEEYRPSQQIMCNITGTYNGTAGVYTAVINTDGTVRTFTGSGTFTAIYCYGIVFPTA